MQNPGPFTLTGVSCALGGVNIHLEGGFRAGYNLISIKVLDFPAPSIALIERFLVSVSMGNHPVQEKLVGNVRSIRSYLIDHLLVVLHSGRLLECLHDLVAARSRHVFLDLHDPLLAVLCVHCFLCYLHRMSVDFVHVMDSAIWQCFFCVDNLLLSSGTFVIPFT